MRRSRCMAAQHAVGTLVIVLGAPRLKDDLRFEQALKEFPVQTLATQLVVEALDVTVLPRATRLDIEGFDLRGGRPVLDGIRDELESVVTPQMPGSAIAHERCLDDRDHILRSDGVQLRVLDGVDQMGLVHGETLMELTRNQPRCLQRKEGWRQRMVKSWRKKVQRPPCGRGRRSGSNRLPVGTARGWNAAAARSRPGG